ncbi:MAG: TM0996/MTH895 family glutaredoxin-like protein [Bacteroidetes bacterium]|nr:TM0996/MTH895 family glutaredoxin-like protein [Bacteroidota bacterium]
MKIKVLGSGCTNCKTLEKRTIEALAALSITAEIEKVTEYADIATYGIMRTPGLVIDGKVVVQGYVPTVEKLQEIIQTPLV